MIEIVIAIIAFVLGLISILGIALGFDLKTKRGWLFVLCAFMIGFLAEFFTKGIITSVSAGFMIALCAIISGPALYRIRKNYGRFKE